MRLAATILAAIMSVTTGGTLRCPCQIQGLLPCSTSVFAISNSHSESTAKQLCSCSTHRDAQELSHSGHEPEPKPESPTCPHGPSIDFVTPIMGGERNTGDRDSAGLAFHFDCLSRVSPRELNSLNSDTNQVKHRSSAFELLRFCHAFHC